MKRICMIALAVIVVTVSGKAGSAVMVNALAEPQNAAPTTYTQPPDILAPQANAGIALQSYKSWVEGQLQGLWVAVNNIPPQGPASALSTATSFTVPACQFSGIYGNPPNVTEISAPDKTCDVGWLTVGEHIIYLVYVPVAGNYNFTANVGNLNAAGAFHLEIGGVAITSTLSVPVTGGWHSWGNLAPVTITLPSGLVPLVVVIDSNTFTLHALNFVKQ